MEIKLPRALDLIKEKVDRLDQRATKELKKEKIALIVTMITVVILTIGVFIGLPLIIYWISFMVLMIINNHYSIKSAQAVSKLSGYADGASDVKFGEILERGGEKLNKLFNSLECDKCPAKDECSDEDKKRHAEKIKKQAPKKKPATK